MEKLIEWLIGLILPKLIEVGHQYWLRYQNDRDWKLRFDFALNSVATATTEQDRLNASQFLQKTLSE